MVNVRTLRGLYAALLECVPGKAQRSRLLEALARVPGNKGVSAAISWLRAREEDSPSQRATPAGRVPAPPKSGVFRTQVITYTQSPPEVQVTMPRGVACALLEAVENVSSLHPNWGLGRDPKEPLGGLMVSLRQALGDKRAAP